MNTVKLNNGIEMPVLGFGTFLITEPNLCEESVLNAINAGYRLIDTAQAYGNEKYIGNAIVKSGISRKELFLTTKVNFRSYGETRQVVETSLKNLQTDYLDLVLLHWSFGDYYTAYRELERLYSEGKIRAIGISNFTPDRMIDLIEFHHIVPTVNQIETHLFCQRKTEHEWLKKYHVQHMAYAPLGQGRKNEMFEQEALRQIAKAHKKSPAQVALRYLIQKNIVVIPKSVHEERIRENIDVFDFELSVEEMQALEKMDTNTPMIGNPENPAMVETAMKW